MISDAVKSKLLACLPEYLREDHKPARERGKWSCGCGSSDALHGYEDSNTWKCYSCGRAGDIFALYALDHDLDPERDFRAITEDLARRYGITLDEDAPRISAQTTAKAPERPKEQQDYSAFIAAAADRLMLTGEDNTPRNYLLKRAISTETAETFRLGAAEWKGRLGIVIPAHKTYQIRIIDPGEGPRYYRPAGAQIEPLECKREGVAQIWFTEGEFNALSVWQAGGAAVAIGGAANSQKAVDYAKKHPSFSYVLAFDNDKAGKECAAKVKKELDGAGISCFSWPYADGDTRDLNDILQEDHRNETAELARMIQQAREWHGLTADTIRRLQKADGVTACRNARAAIKSGVFSVIYQTPWTGLNETLAGGLRPGLVAVGGGTGTGKTMLILQAAAHFAECGHRVLYISLEMSSAELYTRIVSRIIGERSAGPVSALKLRQNPELDRERSAVAAAWDLVEREIAPRLTIIEGIGDFSALQVSELAEYYKRIDSAPPVIIVDYLQLLAPISERMTDKQNADSSIKTLKRTARDLGALVLAISSYNRNSYSQEPSLSAFKESGAIEYTADLVLALDCPEDQPAGEDLRTVNLHCLKNRDGRRGWQNVFTFYPCDSRFVEEETTPESPTLRPII